MQCHNRDVYEKQIIDLQVDHQTIYIFEGKDIFQKLSQIQAQQRLVCNFFCLKVHYFWKLGLLEQTSRLEAQHLYKCIN